MAQSISMTQIPPEGVLKLYSGIEIGGGRQKIFKTKAEQKAYFNDHLVMSFNDLSYIRMGSGIQIETDTVSIGQCNYLSFINKTSGVETEIYAQINPNWEYVNNNCVRIGYAIDWWQTCMHSGLTMKEGIIVREHMNETDWTAATDNPYADIFQLQTSEDLPMDQSMERIADASNGDVSMYPNIPQHDGVTGIKPEDMRMVLILGQTDFSQLQPLDTGAGTTIDLTYIRQQIIAQGGRVTTDATIQGVPNTCTIFVMKYIPVGVGPSQSVSVFRKLLDLLTFNGIAGNIVGLYWIPHNYVDNISELSARISFTPKPYNYKPRNPKLYRAPYCYLRVSDETGQFKHYEWEEFKQLISGNTMISFDLFFSQIGVPVILIAPREYKATLASDANTSELLFANFDEAIIHENIPQLPFSTDGYLSALGSKYRENWAGTSIKKNMLTDAAISGSPDAESGNFNLMNVLGTASQYVRHPIKTAKAVATAAIDEDAQPLIDLTNQGRNTVSRMLTGVGLNLKKATVADNYNEGSSGWAGYMRAPLRFIFQKVCPRADIVEQYDKYFDYFGYSSGRIGLPYVYNYITRTGDQPHFATINDEQVTYCQANISCYTNGKAPDIAARAIEAMFAQGVLFTK